MAEYNGRKIEQGRQLDVEFLEIAETNQKRQEWFVEQEAVAYADRDFVPSSSQCIGFAVPAVFAEGGTPDTAFVVDIYEHVSFLGDLHQHCRLRLTEVKYASASFQDPPRSPD